MAHLFTATRRWASLAVVALAVAGPLPALAQGLFSPVILVNEDAITGFEIDQRARMLEVFRTPGDLDALAREQLIEERLKLAELERVGLQITDESLRAAMEEFAQRANLGLDDFLVVLGQNGVEEETLRDFVLAGTAWRDYIRQRFGSRAEITEAEIDAALGAAAGGGSEIEVLLNEIIIPAPPPEADRVLAVAREISTYTTTGAFEAAARQYSALPSKAQGGRLDWLPITNYPAPIRALLLALAPGEVTAPIPITNGVALFQMRDVREVAAPPATPVSIDYAVYYAADAAEAGAVVARVDTCDDLYGIAQGLPPERLVRADQAVEAIPQDIALLLARLDTDEISVAPAGGTGLVAVVMLCGRTFSVPEGVDRETVENQLRSQRLAGYADALLADLRAAAVIVGE